LRIEFIKRKLRTQDKWAIDPCPVNCRCHAPSIYRLAGINEKLFRWGAHPSGEVFKRKLKAILIQPWHKMHNHGIRMETKIITEWQQ
jgi:hypothetical protein